MIRLSSLLCPPKCLFCRERLPFDTDLPFCKTCRDEWEKETEEVCGFCNKPVRECLCTTELMQKAGLRVLFKTAYYKAGRRTLPNRVLFRMKETSSARLYSFLGEALAPGILEYLNTEKIAPDDCLFVHAPRHRRAAAGAGMDQAERLAKELSGRLAIKRVAAIVRKRMQNRTQKALNIKGRLENAKHSFALFRSADLKGKTVLLVDDTVTTGATMVACAKLLKSAGAKRVLCVSVTFDEVGRNPREAAFSTKPYA